MQPRNRRSRRSAQFYAVSPSWCRFFSWVGSGAGFLLLRSIRDPVKELMGGVLAIGRGDLRRRVAVQGRGELAELAAQFNQMAAQLEATTVSKERLEISENQLQQVNTELRHSEERYRTLVNNAPDITFTLSLDGAITSLNPAFEAITGWSRAEWLGKSFPPILHPDDVPRAMEIFQHTIRGEVPPMVEIRVLTQAGAYIVEEFKVTPQLAQGSVVSVMGLGRDITERKRAEVALQEEIEVAVALARVGRELISLLTTPAILDRLCQLSTEHTGVRLQFHHSLATGGRGVRAEGERGHYL